MKEMIIPMEEHMQSRQNGLKQGQVAVVMVPLPAQGHLNQLLQLSRIISTYDIQVHYVGTTTHNRQAKHRIHGWDLHSATNIHFHDFETPPFPTPPPDPNASHKFPLQLLPAFYASSHLRQPVYAFLRKLSTTSRRVIVIHDSNMTCAVQDIPSISPNIESYCFQGISAFSILSFYLENTRKNLSPIEPEILLPKDMIDSCLAPEVVEFLMTQPDTRNFNSGNLFNTCKAIEGRYLDLLAKEQFNGAEKQWAIGPFNPVVTKNSNHHRCLEWLDKQTPNSVIFVSFGTTTSLSDQQIKEIATGLERSMHNFIWVLRDADKGDVFAGGEVRNVELPKGYEEESVKGRGLVVRDWAPQLEVLGHPATGGFMSHCGWNSCMESISMGVPIAAWPMHSDQPINAFLITEFLKIGLVVRDWRRRDELVTSLDIEKAVQTLMASEELRKRATDVGEVVRQSVAEGGVTRMELDSFIAHITR